MLRAKFANDAGALWPGQSLAVQVGFGNKVCLVLIQGVAVAPQAAGSVVPVVKTDSSIAMRQVTVAMHVGDIPGLSDGLPAGGLVNEHFRDFHLTAGRSVFRPSWPILRPT